MDQEEKTILNARAVQKYGIIQQSIKLIEELAEVQQALLTYLVRPSKKTDQHLAEEIADAQIMIGQFEYLVMDDVENWRQKKRKRLEERLDNGGKE